MSANEEWEEFAAAYLESHPEISAAIPEWAEEVDFDDIDLDGSGEASFTFTRKVGMATLWGHGTRAKDGAVQVDAAPDIIIEQRGELNTTTITDAANLALSLSVNLQNVISILNASRRTLRRPADVDDRLREMDQ